MLLGCSRGSIASAATPWSLGKNAYWKGYKNGKSRAKQAGFELHESLFLAVKSLNLFAKGTLAHVFHRKGVSGTP
jgi:hypothetical protein